MKLKFEEIKKWEASWNLFSENWDALKNKVVIKGLEMEMKQNMIHDSPN